MKRTYVFMAAAGLAVLAACSKKPQQAQEAPTVKLEKVVAAGEAARLDYPGKVKAAQDVSLSFKVSGTLSRILVDDGAHVRAGQLLAELDDTDYRVQLAATEAEYSQVKAEAERVMRLYRDSVTTANANDKAMYGLQQITAKYQHHQDQLRYTRLYAPFDGYIQSHIFHAHETVGAGMPVLSMVSGGVPEVEIHLPAAEYVRQEAFGSYQCTFDVYPGQTYALRPISLSPKANANQLYAMRLQLVVGKGQPVPSPGMNTMVRIGIRPDGGQTQLSVPSTALFTDGGQTHVYLFRPAEGKVQACRVEVLQLTGNGRATISSDAVRPGDEIVTAGVHSLKDGEVVQRLPETSETNVGGLL